MTSRVAILGIIVENSSAIADLNALLHEYRDYIIGRMGIPYPKRAIHVISIAMDAPQDKIASLSGKIGQLEGISCKAAYSNKIFAE